MPPPRLLKEGGGVVPWGSAGEELVGAGRLGRRFFPFCSAGACDGLRREARAGAGAKL